MSCLAITCSLHIHNMVHDDFKITSKFVVKCDWQNVPYLMSDEKEGRMSATKLSLNATTVESQIFPQTFELHCGVFVIYFLFPFFSVLVWRSSVTPVPPHWSFPFVDFSHRLTGVLTRRAGTSCPGKSLCSTHALFNRHFPYCNFILRTQKHVFVMKNDRTPPSFDWLWNFAALGSAFSEYDVKCHVYFCINHQTVIWCNVCDMVTTLLKLGLVSSASVNRH